MDSEEEWNERNGEDLENANSKDDDDEMEGDNGDDGDEEQKGFIVRDNYLSESELYCGEQTETNILTDE